jgi:hypothetical protein
MSYIQNLIEYGLLILNLHKCEILNLRQIDSLKYYNN